MFQYRIVCLASVMAALLVPYGTVQAYSTSAQSAERLTEESAVFTIDFTLGRFRETTFIPVLARRDTDEEISATDLFYELREDQDTYTTAGDTMAIVLADLPISDDGLYELKPGMRVNARLIVTLETSTTTPEADYAVQVRTLPFFHGEDMRRNGLTRSELSTYLTPEIELNAYEGAKPERKVTGATHSLILNN